MDDLISRQAAIKYLMTNMNWYDEDGYETDEDEKEDAIKDLINGVPSAQTEPHYCRECKWSRCHINADKHGKSETYWWCLNWDGETDEEGYCHEYERRTDERLQIRRHDRHSA